MNTWKEDSIGVKVKTKMSDPRRNVGNRRRVVRNYSQRGRISNSTSNMGNEIRETFWDGLDYVKSRTVNYYGDSESVRSNRLKALVGFSGALIFLPFAGGMSLIAAGYGGLKAYQASKDRRGL